MSLKTVEGSRVSARQQLDAIKTELFQGTRALKAPLPAHVLFVTDGTGPGRAEVSCFTGDCIEVLWEAVICQLAKRLVNKALPPKRRKQSDEFSSGIKFEVVTECHTMPLQRLKEAIAATKRNYFRFGVALDEAFAVSFTESEIHSHAMFYKGPDFENGGWNEKNILRHIRTKYGRNGAVLPEKSDMVHTFVAKGIYLNGSNQIYKLNAKGLSTGQRKVSSHSDMKSLVPQLTQSATDYLCRQLDVSGYMRYGYFPSFGRQIPGSNSLRQVCATLALIESSAAYQNERYLKAAKISINYLVSHNVHTCAINGKITSYLTESNHEIKLGGCGLLLLALVRYSELSGRDHYKQLMRQLADGLMDGFGCTDESLPAHVLDASTMRVKEPFRTVYYEGEALFGLVSYAQMEKCERSLEFCDLLFDHLEQNKRWKYRDHWLAYACDKMFEVTGNDKFVRFAAKNISGYLPFIANRITVFPTLLELCMATDRVARRYGVESFFKLAGFSADNFYEAVDRRATRMLDAYFWPEMAMNFYAPEEIVGSFYIRHHAFRVRVDDVGHFILGLLAYNKEALIRLEAS